MSLQTVENNNAMPSGNYSHLKKNKREKNDSTKDPMRNRTRLTRLKIMVLNHYTTGLVHKWTELQYTTYMHIAMVQL